MEISHSQETYILLEKNLEDIGPSLHNSMTENTVIPYMTGKHSLGLVSSVIMVLDMLYYIARLQRQFIQDIEQIPLYSRKDPEETGNWKSCRILNIWSMVQKILLLIIKIQCIVM